MDKLLPCPFCGGESRYEKFPDGCHAVDCTKCLSGTRVLEESLTKEDVYRIWNTRHTPEGWRLVPDMPNENMIDEGCKSQDRGCKVFGDNQCQIVNNIYEDMLAAAPKWGGE